MTAATDLLVSGIVAATASEYAASRVVTNAMTNTKVIGALLPKIDSWWLLNTDTSEPLHGPFPATQVTENVSSTYENTFALNRQKAIKQFLHGNVETITFTARFYSMFVFQEVEEKVQKLKSWVRRDESKGRPPILYFWIGDQHVQMAKCVITSVSATYDRPGFLGSMRGATLNISLERYDPFSLTETASFDTRYHFAKLGDTYEMLAAREYGNPMLGVELRDRHPHQRRLEAGQTVKLPSRTGPIKRTKVQPKSIALKNILARKTNPQKSNLVAKLSERRAAQYQHTIS